MLALARHAGLLRKRAAAVETDPYWANVSSLLQFTGAGAVERKGLTISTIGSPSVINTDSPFASGYCLDCPTTSDGMAVAIGSGGAFGTGDFTIELFVKFLGGSDLGWFIGNNNSSLAWTIAKYFAASKWLAYFDNTGNATGYPQSQTAMTAGTWYAMAITRESGTMRGYKAGVKEFEASQTFNFTSTADYAVGRPKSGEPRFVGRIAEVRITKGVARYTGATYAVPTAPFPTS